MAVGAFDAHLGGTVVAGPVELVQGGRAFIARTPIYTHGGLDYLGDPRRRDRRTASHRRVDQ